MLVAYRQAVGRFQSALRHITGASVRLPFVVQTHLSCLPDVACGVLLDGLNVSLQAAGEAPMPIRTVLIALSLLIAVACAQVDRHQHLPRRQLKHPNRRQRPLPL